MAEVKKTKEELTADVLRLTRSLREAEKAKAADTKAHGDHIKDLKAKIVESMDAIDKT